MMFPWARQKSSVTPITGMILPFVWPFLGHVAYYPLPWLVRIFPSFPDRPWSQSSSSEHNGNLHTVNLTADVNSNLQRSSRTTSLWTLLPSRPWNGDCELQPPSLSKSFVPLDRLASDRDRRASLGLRMSCRYTFSSDDPSRPPAPSYYWSRPTPGPWRLTTSNPWRRLSWYLLGSRFDVWRNVEILVGCFAAAMIAAVCCFVGSNSKSKFSGDFNINLTITKRIVSSYKVYINPLHQCK